MESLKKVRKKSSEIKVKNNAFKRLGMMKIYQAASVDGFSNESPTEQIIGEEELFTVNINLTSDS